LFPSEEGAKFAPSFSFGEGPGSFGYDRWGESNMGITIFLADSVVGVRQIERALLEKEPDIEAARLNRKNSYREEKEKPS
jgi:hypothetical protein